MGIFVGVGVDEFFFGMGVCGRRDRVGLLWSVCGKI